MLNLNHLTVFHAVAEAGNVSRGAEKLLVSQPAVSKQIRELEKAVQTKLFDRHAKGVKPTAAGQLLAGYSARIFSLLAEAEGALEDLGSLRRGRLAIGAGPTVGVYLLPRVLVHFRRRFPGIRLHVEVEGADLLRERLQNRSIDFALTESEMTGPELESRVFITDELVPIVPSNHAFAGRRSVPASLFCQEPFIARQTVAGTKSLVERTLEGRGLHIAPVLTLGTTEAIKQAVIVGIGVAMVSKLAVQTELTAGLLKCINVPGLAIRYPLYHVRCRGQSEARSARAFHCLLKHAVRGTLPKLPKRV